MNRDVELPWLDAGASAKKPIPKSVWGPRGWYWLHNQAINYPASPAKHDQTAMFARLWSFIMTLPCPECRIHAASYSRDYPPDFSGSTGFQTWAWRFHNAVNYRLGKPLMTAGEYQETYREELAQKYWNCV